MKETIFIDREDANLVEKEERDIFIKSVIIELGLEEELEGIWDDIHIESVSDKIKFKEVLEQYNIIILETGREYEIYVENEVVARWRAPQFSLRKDYKQIDPKKKLYLEMIIDKESIFDEDKEENESKENE